MQSNAELPGTGRDRASRYAQDATAAALVLSDAPVHGRLLPLSSGASSALLPRSINHRNRNSHCVSGRANWRARNASCARACVAVVAT